MPPLPRKKVRTLTKIETKARLDAESSFRLSAKGIKTTLVKMMDRIDPIEALAVVSGTFVVYDIFKSTPELLAQAKSFLFTPPVAIAWPIISLIVDRIWGNQELTAQQKVDFQKIKEELDPVLMVKSFFIAYVLVKHSGQIIAGVGNITGFIAGFLGLKVV